MAPTAAAARPLLPPLHLLDSDKFRRDESASMTNSASGTPAPFAHHHHHHHHHHQPSPAAAFGASPRSSFRAETAPRTQESRDARESVGSAPKQTLPSLSEALGGHDAVSPPSSRPLPDSPQSRPASNRPSPPRGPPVGHYPAADMSDHRRRDYPEQIHASYTHKSPSQGSLPDVAGPHGHPPSSQFTFGYAPTNAPYAPQPPYHTPTVSPPSEPSQAWRSAHPGAPVPPPVPQQAPRAGPAYSDSVKRHLDYYDFEVSLNKVADYGTVMLDFSRSYAARLQQAQRIGMVPGTLPAITEVEDLINKSRHNTDNLARLREALVAQQAAYYHQAQEQQHVESGRVDSFHGSDDMKMNGGEPKKRRGRNAAPGRCHSCNRAETPEWRRGPDGARTLCNACGLHYAKLTRKAGASKLATESSSLQPKSN